MEIVWNNLTFKLKFSLHLIVLAFWYIHKLERFEFTGNCFFIIHILIVKSCLQINSRCWMKRWWSTRKLSTSQLYQVHMDAIQPSRSTYIHTYIHTYTHTYIHTYIHTDIHTYIHTHTHTHTHTHIHTYIHTYWHTYIHTYIHTCILTYIHTYIHTHIYYIGLHMTHWRTSSVAAVSCNVGGGGRDEMQRQRRGMPLLSLYLALILYFWLITSESRSGFLTCQGYIQGPSIGIAVFLTC